MENINVAELLKDCPKGMELDCTMFDRVYFDHVNDLGVNKIKCYVNNSNEHFEIALNKYGQFVSYNSAKCVIFPKGKTTWEGFVPPYKYPKTYEECCDVLKIEYPYFKTEEDGISASTYKNKLFGALKQLLICRDVYWKIAGEQMGLGKSWRPSKSTSAYCIFRYKGDIVKDNFVFSDSLILEFPTEEMRDAFFENFGHLIELCKELL